VTEAEALFAAICDSPADDLPRLVYADWLDEHGASDYAEFIRVQCELARVPIYDRLWAKARLDANWWLGGVPYQIGAAGPNSIRRLPSLPHDQSWVVPFRRGFPAGVRSPRLRDIPDLIRHAARLAPLEHLTIQSPGHLDLFAFLEMLQDPQCSRFRAWQFESGQLLDAHIQALDRARTVQQVQELRFQGEAITPQGLFQLFRSRLMNSLTRLAIQEMPWPEGVSPNVLRGVFGAPFFPNHLEALDVSGTPLPWEWLFDQLEPQAEQTLIELNLSGTFPDDGGRRYLSYPHRFPQLQMLTLNDDPDREIPPVDFLLVMPRWRALLAPGQQFATAAEAEAFASSPGLGELRLLDCQNCTYGDALAVALANSPHLMNLHELRLQRCELTNRAGLALVNSPYLKNLANLQLPRRGMTPPICAALQDRFGPSLVFHPPIRD
jgi:uncharacterized protein (TIGR02996 family)